MCLIFQFLLGGTNAGSVNLGINFGANESWTYTPPAGFKSLCTNNLPPSASSPILKPQENFDTLLYTGSQNTSNVVTGLKFRPDFVWIKARSGSSAPNSQSHYLVDSVRGATGSVTKKLYSNSDGAENSGQNDSDNGV